MDKDLTTTKQEEANAHEEKETECIGELINEVIVNIGKHDVYKSVAKKVEELCVKFPLYADLQ